LQKPVFAVAGIIGLIVAAAVVYSIIKFRDKGQPIPKQSHGNPALEITLTIIPALILAVVGVFTFRTVFDLNKTSDTQMIINVTGQQWWWEYDYPTNNEYGITQPIITSGQLVIPVGTKVLLREVATSFTHIGFLLSTASVMQYLVELPSTALRLMSQVFTRVSARSSAVCHMQTCAWKQLP
jgi:cytochrome c oxidase subunit 2